MDNKVNFTIPAEVLDQAKAKIAELEALIEPYIIELTPNERKRQISVSDGNLPFVEKTLQYTQNNPEFNPAFLDATEFSNDFSVYQSAKPLMNSLKQLHTGIENTVMGSGAEAYTQALTYYNSVKYAHKMGMPDAKDIYDDLRTRFRN